MADAQSPDDAAFGADDVEIDGRRLAYDGFFKVHQLQLRHRLFHGGWSETLSRELLIRRDAVGVLPYDPALDAVLLIEQLRVGALQRPRSPWLLELVAGLIDEGEQPPDVARREALEEAGCELAELEPIHGYFSSPGGTSEYFHLFCGRARLDGAGGVFGLPEEGEDIRARVFSIEEALQALAAGRVADAHSLIALQWLQLQRPRLRALWR